MLNYTYQLLYIRIFVQIRLPAGRQVIRRGYPILQTPRIRPGDEDSTNNMLKEFF
jgi:hypothetical protein